MSRYVFAVALLAVLGAVSLVFMRPRVVHAQASNCSIPKSAGTYREVWGNGFVFESESGTLSLYSFDCKLWETVTRTQDQQSQAAQPAKSTAAAPAVELKEGQTPAEVEKMLGNPSDTVTLKGSLIYIYPTVKVIFEEDKLVGVQEKK